MASISARAEGIPARPSFDEDVQPLLKARCIKCHGPVKPKGKLNLSSARSLARGGESGAVVAPGSLEESTLWEQVAGDEMPPKPEEPLSADEKATLRRWIEQGAAGLPRAADLEARAARGRSLGLRAGRPTPASRRCETPPAFARPSIASSMAALEERGLALGPEADRATLIRRLSFDLTGLPPTPEEIAAFVADRRPDAYERLVERLLASPRYGERWGKYWLDACRLRRVERLLQRRHRSAAGLSLSRLRHPGVQRRPAARPDRPRATRRR